MLKKTKMFTKPLTRALRYMLIKPFFLATGWSYLHDLSHTFLRFFCTQPRFLVYLNTLSCTLFILGYHYWKFVADHVGLKEEKKNWEQSDNPAEKFLHAFSVKEHSTIGKLMEACGEEAGLTLFVSELKNKFSAANQSGSFENLAPNGSTWV